MHKEDIRDTEQLPIFLKEINEPAFRLKQINEWLWQKGAQTFAEMTNLSAALREKLAAKFSFCQTVIATERRSKDATVKFIFQLHDGLFVEGVLIPSETRVTACISSQVGCPLQCIFCATGAAGFKRNLHYSEIFDQYMLMNRRSVELYGLTISNIVYMGMGEPLLNFDNVVYSIQILTEKWGQALSPSRITVSTVGLVDGIKKLADQQLKVSLALSLHCANELKRIKLMPITRTNRLDDVRKACTYFAEKGNSRITIEYLMLRDETDSLKDAANVALFCRAFPVKINIIEYNTTQSGYTRSSQDTVAQFIEFLESKNMIVNLRRSRGQDIEAACGQLFTIFENKKS
ncbi:MAG: 23S rRNA (adenine(2503)-C(2))-methyltransferase RlmN [Bacteroidales bacterium]|jgi:23S rRNA (adenine2503-C2)-methyltransferase|nr:23S rRNA (adenine(2503)-C(2))-methyltransferase RlmN [Bacteroidales bacterium]